MFSGLGSKRQEGTGKAPGEAQRSDRAAPQAVRTAAMVRGTLDSRPKMGKSCHTLMWLWNQNPGSVMWAVQHRDNRTQRLGGHLLYLHINIHGKVITAVLFHNTRSMSHRGMHAL